MVVAELERLIQRLRTKIRLSGLEDDDWKSIIYIENYIINYGTKVAKDTLTAHSLADENESILILCDVLQTAKSENELFIYKTILAK